MLTIAVDASSIRDRPSGVGVYTLNLITALQSLQTEAEFKLQVYFQPGVKAWLSGQWQPPSPLQQPEISESAAQCLPLPVTITDLLTSFPNPVLPWLERQLPHPDVIHGTDHYSLPCRHSRNLLTIHDLTFCRFPQFVPPLVKRYQQRIQRCLSTADGILTFAENTKREIATYFEFPADRIFVTQQASRFTTTLPVFAPTDSIPFDFSSPYFLFVSTLEPRKNITGLVAAFNHLKQCHRLPHQLVLIGQRGWKYDPILGAIANSPYADEIHQLSYVSDQWLATFYQQATAFVYPSFYEGFGLPVLEAMTFGVPVITSDRASLPGVAGDAALLVNPDHPEAIADAMQQVVTNGQLRHQLQQKSQQRAQQFSWQKTAQQTLAVYRALLE